jgi:hypothetical protein
MCVLIGTDASPDDKAANACRIDSIAEDMVHALRTR